MKYETAQTLTLPKIGFGTWKIGGGSFATPSADSVSLAALHSAIETGYTHFDTAEMYANGHAEELLGKAIRSSQIKREALFITSKRVSKSEPLFAEILHRYPANVPHHMEQQVREVMSSVSYRPPWQAPSTVISTPRTRSSTSISRLPDSSSFWRAVWRTRTPSLPAPRAGRTTTLPASSSRAFPASVKSCIRGTGIPARARSDL